MLHRLWGGWEERPRRSDPGSATDEGNMMESEGALSTAIDIELEEDEEVELLEKAEDVDGAGTWWEDSVEEDDEVEVEEERTLSSP